MEHGKTPADRADEPPRTTYSSFNLETTQFMQNRAWLSGLLNFGATVVACFVAGLLGFVVARRAFGP